MRVRLTRAWGAVVLFAAAPSVAAQTPLVSYLGSPGFTGCAPGGGIPLGLTYVGVVSLGPGVPALQLHVSPAPGIPNNPFFLVLGTCAAAPLPVPPTLGCPASILGCYSFIDPSGFLVAFGPNSVGCAGFGEYCFPLPNDPTLIGASLCAQAIEWYAPSPTPPCLVVSNGISVTFV